MQTNRNTHADGHGRDKSRPEERFGGSRGHSKTGVTEQVSRISWDKDTIESGEREEQGLHSSVEGLAAVGLMRTVKLYQHIFP